MAELIHTADVHIRPDTDERRDALQAVLQRAADHDPVAVTIGGDLFDRPEDVDRLRGDLRDELFTGHPFEILLIPGNHDVAAYQSDLFFGDACTVLTAPEDGYDTWTAPDESLRVVGVPYQEEATDDLLLALQRRDRIDGTDVLLFHGSLDAPLNADAGSEDAHRYFPVTEGQLDSLEFDYYLAGHYHGPHHRQFDSGAELVYPGTPASTRCSETGRRQFVTLDTTSGLGFESMDTFHYLDHVVTVMPSEEEAALQAVEEWITSTVNSSAKASLTVEGLVEGSESAFAERLAETTESAAVDVTNQVISVGEVRHHPVLEQFEERLAATDWGDGTKQNIWNRVLRAANEVRVSGGLD